MYTCIHLHACMHAYIHDKYIVIIIKRCTNDIVIYIYMNLEENFSMCFKHRLKHIICSIIVLRHFEHFVLTDENKYACVKCMLN